MAASEAGPENAKANYRIGVDIGGTFTDVVLWDLANSRTEKTKLLTTPEDPSRAVMAGISSILGTCGVAPGEVDTVIHGTTLVANALIERKGVTTGLITTRGFRDVLEIGREWRYDLFDLEIEMPRPIADRPRRLEISERIGPDGVVIQEVLLDELEAIVETFRRLDVASAAVCLLHAYRNPVHEVAIRDRLKEIAPELPVSISSTVNPEMGEYDAAPPPSPMPMFSLFSKPMWTAWSPDWRPWVSRGTCC
jgi:N-methylhydantoinase A/oxoprolinase/acetone carboxylase beta subunit